MGKCETKGEPGQFDAVEDAIGDLRVAVADYGAAIIAWADAIQRRLDARQLDGEVES